MSGVESVQTLASGAHASATTETYDVATAYKKNLILVSDVTANGGAFSQTVSILGIDPVSGKTWTILAGAAQTSNATQVLQVGEHLTAAANLTANALLPPTIRVSITHTDATSVTRTISLQFV